MKKEKKRTRVRVAAIIVRKDKILLAKHEREGVGYWVLPGGGVDYGETAEEALVRELKEEADLDIRVNNLVMVNDSVPPDKHRHIINLYFTADITGGKLKLGHDPRLVGMQFVPLRKLPTLTMYPDTREELLKGVADGFSSVPAYLGNLWKDE